jgi:hypothetical protein
MLTQRRDHRRLGGQFNTLQPAVAMAEALAGRGDADEVTDIEMLAYVRQELQWKVQQGGLVWQGFSHGKRQQGSPGGRPADAGQT